MSPPFDGCFCFTDLMGERRGKNCPVHDAPHPAPAPQGWAKALPHDERPGDAEPYTDHEGYHP
jgi:hypothetical protein